MKDDELHIRLKKSLEELGHEVLGIGLLSAGADISKELNKLLHNSDAVVAILTENSINSKNVLNEVAVAQAQMDAIDKKIFVPIIVGSIEVPNFLRDKLAEVVTDFSEENLARVSIRINQAIEHFQAIRNEAKKVKNKLSEKLEVSKTEFIKEAESRLNKKETDLKFSANLWYSLGYIALILGVIGTFYLAKESYSTDLSLANIILLAIKAIVGVGLLVASSKYSFMLGKSYMNESLKNSDRLHAISFGKFYLQAYGDIATPDDVKDVFQHWNMDKNSSFSESKPDVFDPKIIEAVVEMSKILSKDKPAKST